MKQMKSSKKSLSVLLILIIAAIGISYIFNGLPAEHISSFSASTDGRYECFMILAGKNATIDGSVLLAHNNDLTGTEASLLEKHPRERHDANEPLTSYTTGQSLTSLEKAKAFLKELEK